MWQKNTNYVNKKSNFSFNFIIFDFLCLYFFVVIRNMYLIRKTLQSVVLPGQMTGLSDTHGTKSTKYEGK